MSHEALSRSARRVRLGGDDVPSPCLSICRMVADSGLCEGCLRRIDEIAQWGRMDSAGKRAVWARIEQRIVRLQDNEA